MTAIKKSKELSLLVDLAGLVKKYGFETFEELADTISSPEITQQLSHILMQVSNTAKTTPNAEHKKVSDYSIPKALIKLQSADNEKYRALIDFHGALVAKEVLPSLKDIKVFALNNGLLEITAESRQKAIGPLITSLIQIPTNQLLDKIKSLKKYGSGDRSLEGWSRIILKKP